MIPDSFKQDLLNRIDVVEVVGRYVRLKKAGANFQGLCPFHNEKSPSFSVSPTKQFYHCFGCGAHGNAIGFLMSYGGMGYVDAIKDLASQVGMQVPEIQRSPEQAKRESERKEKESSLGSVLEEAMAFYRAELKNAPQAIEYLKRRGLTGEIAARFRIGYAPDDWQGLKRAFPNYEDAALVEAGLVIANDGKRYDRFRDRVMFPIFNARGAVIGFGGRVMGDGEPKYLNSPETPVFQKGREVYGLVQAREAIRDSGRILVVEGYMDVVALAQFGVGYAVATLGTATTPEHVTKLLRLADELVFSFDGDNAGRKAAWRALEVSLPLATDAKPLRFLFLPQGEDPDTYVRKHGPEAFEKLVREAPPLSAFLLGELRAAVDLSTAEGRSQFLVNAKPLVQKVAAPALKLQLVKEIAELARVSQEEAERLLELPRSAPTFQRPAPGRTAAPLAVTQERHLLRCVLVQPSLVEELDQDLLDPDLPETAALKAIAALPAEALASGASVVEHFQGTPHEAPIFSLQAGLLHQAENGDGAAPPAEEFRQIQLALQIKRLNREVEALNREAARDPALRPELQRRLQELTLLKSRRN